MPTVAINRAKKGSYTMNEDQKQPTDAENQANDQLIIEFDGGTETDAPTDETNNDSLSADDQAPVDVSQAEIATLKSKDETDSKPINQEAVQKKINKAIYEKYEEIRKREALEAELTEARKKLDAVSKDVVNVPDMPDAFDPDFDLKVKARDEALKKQAQIEAQQIIERQNTEQAMKKAAEAEREKITGYVNNMYTAAEKLGMKKDDLTQADNVVAGFIKDPGLATFIISHDKAPLIINHLASNITELEMISKMNPIQASAYIVASVLPNAQQYKPAVPSTPDPLEIPAGKPAGQKNPYLEGVVIE